MMINSSVVRPWSSMGAVRAELWCRGAGISTTDMARGVAFGTGNGVARCLLGTSWSGTGAEISFSISFPSDSMLGISGDGEFESSTPLIVAGGERLGSRGMMCRDCRFAVMVPTVSYCLPVLCSLT
jgi:hypothetical protein